MIFENYVIISKLAPKLKHLISSSFLLRAMVIVIFYFHSPKWTKNY